MQSWALPALEPRVFAWWNVIMLCNSVRAVFVGMLFTPRVGWLEVFLQATETCPNSETKITYRQGLKNAENFNCSSSNGFGTSMTAMSKLSASFPVTLTKLSASFPATLSRTSILFWGQRNHILRCPRIVAPFAVLLIDCEEWFYILLGSLPSARRAIVCILFSL